MGWFKKKISKINGIDIKKGDVIQYKKCSDSIIREGYAIIKKIMSPTSWKKLKIPETFLYANPSFTNFLKKEMHKVRGFKNITCSVYSKKDYYIIGEFYRQNSANDSLYLYYLASKLLKAKNQNRIIIIDRKKFKFDN